MTKLRKVFKPQSWDLVAAGSRDTPLILDCWNFWSKIKNLFFSSSIFQKLFSPPPLIHISSQMLRLGFGLPPSIKMSSSTYLSYSQVAALKSFQEIELPPVTNVPRFSWNNSHRCCHHCNVYFSEKARQAWSKRWELPWRRILWKEPQYHSCWPWIFSIYNNTYIQPVWYIQGVSTKKHRKNCECCPGHSLTVSQPSKLLSL